MYRIKDIIKEYSVGHFIFKFIPELDNLFRLLIRYDKCNLDEFKNFYGNAILACNYTYSNNEYLPYVADVINSLNNDYVKLIEAVNYDNPCRKYTDDLNKFNKDLINLLHSQDNIEEISGFYIIPVLKAIDDFTNYSCITVMQLYTKSVNNGICKVYYDIQSQEFKGEFRKNNEEIVLLRQINSNYKIAYSISDYEANATVQSIIKDMFKNRHESKLLTKHLIDGKYIKCSSLDELNNIIDILNKEFGNSIIICRDCNNLYFLSNDEYNWYVDRELELPCRCKFCRNRRKTMNF